jgi:uncharacterized protein YndB with AHSA1/START domain
MGKEFEIVREVELPGTPEAVFEAVSTEKGNASWLFPTEGEGVGNVVTSDPPHHLVLREEGPEGWWNQLEFRIEARGDGAWLRYVHSGVFDEENWDAQYDAVSAHTDFYLHTLGQYLEHFSPRTATYVGSDAGGLQGPEASMTPDAFTTLQAALGVPESASVGDRVRLAHDDVDGVIDYKTDAFLGVRTDEALYRFFGRNAFGGPVGMSIHHFGSVDAEAAGAAWTDWMNGVYTG